MTRTNSSPAIWFLLPAVLVYGVFVLWPVLQTVWLGATGGAWARLAGDPHFWRALGNNLLLLVVSLVIQLPAAMVLALLLTGRLPGRGLFRTLYFAPVVVPSAAAGFLWRFIYAPTERGGLVNGLLALVGLPAVDWLGDPSVDVFAVTLVVCWVYIGFYTVLFMAGLESIPAELYEAARLDGAGEWQAFRDITVPMMRRVVAVAATLSIIGSLKYFDIFYVLSPNGGSAGSADLVTTYLYRTAFLSKEPGYACAMATALLAVILVIAVPVMRILHGKREA